MELYSSLAQLTNADKINLFNALGAWVAAIGTISAVAVALYLARLDKIIRVKITVGHRLVGAGSDVTSYKDHCSIRAVNMGSRKVTITGVGWKVGFFKKRMYEQLLPIPAYPSKMPVTLGDGEEATWLIPFISTDGNPNWIDTFPQKVLGRNPRLASKSVKIFLYTSVGKPIVAPIEKPLREMLVAAALKRS